MMTKEDVQRLLKSYTSWTGEEVGTVLLASAVNDIVNGKKGKAEALISQEDFDRLESNLDSPKDVEIYGAYKAIYGAILEAYMIGQDSYQQFLNGYISNIQIIREAKNTDKAQSILRRFPVVIYEDDYDRARIKAEKEIKARKYSIKAVILRCMQILLLQGEGDPEPYKKKMPEVWEALERAKKIPATDSQFLQAGNRVKANGFYSLPGGARSDQMEAVEFEKRRLKEILKVFKYYKEDKKATAKETVKQYEIRQLHPCYKLYFEGLEALGSKEREELEGLPDSAILEGLEEVISTKGKPISHNGHKVAQVLGCLKPVTWHPLDQCPDGLSLYDILYEITQGLKSAFFEHCGNILIDVIKNDYNDLYCALLRSMGENLRKPIETIERNLNRKVYSYNTLARAGIIGFPEEPILPDAQLIRAHEGLPLLQEEETPEERSIIIVRDPAQAASVADLNPLESFDDIYSLQGDEEYKEIIADNVESYIYLALRYVFVYNSYIEIISKAYNLPKGLLDDILMNLNPYHSHIDDYNNLLYSFYFHISGNIEEKVRKRKIIKELFKPLSTEGLEPCKKEISAIIREIKRDKFSRDVLSIVELPGIYINRLLRSSKEA